ncbi:hypothetical protein ACEWY4_000471 [Coilia grayii]|uniref:PGC-1 and ERR-induced regulator in muscle protein 1 n=1 Tax=Coilia grayii TaxID=363190 RepID=A0ABD1KWS0_9TELE
MDDFEYSVQMSEQDWDTFFHECEECDMLPPVLAGLDDSGMSDLDELACTVPHRRSRQGREVAQPDTDLNDGPLPKGSPVDMYLDRYGLRSPDYVLSGSEDDMHLESVNRFFEHLRSMTSTAEPSLKHHPAATGNVKRTQESFDDEYPPISHLPKAPLGVKKNQDALSSGDVRPKSKTESRLLAKHTGIPSKATTDWCTRSMELSIREDEWPVNPKKSPAMKENDERDAVHNNNLAKDTQLVQLRSSDTGAGLSSDLAGCRNGTEVMRGGDAAYGQAVLRKNSEQPQGQSPSTTPRRKKKRRKRMSMEPVEAALSYEGQFQGNLSDSDEDRRSHKTEMEKHVCLPGEFKTVKMADKGSDPKRLSLQHPMIDSFSDRLPVQANSRKWSDSVTGPRELSTAGNQDDGIDLPRAPPEAYHSQTLMDTELRPRSIDMFNGRCFEEPLSPVQFVEKNSCKPDETPVSANVQEQTTTHIFNNSVSTQGEGDKVLGNSKRTMSQPLQAQKSDQVPVCHSPIANMPKIAPSPLDAQIKTGLPISQNGGLEGEVGPCHSSAPLPQISNSSALGPGKKFPLGDSSVRAKTQNVIRPKLSNETNVWKNLQDLCLGFDLKRNVCFNQMAPTFHTENSFDVPEVSTESTGATESHSSTTVGALKCAQLVKIPHEPTNKDSTALSNNVSQAMSDVRGAEPQTLLLDNNNKPSALPAHLHGPAATAECPPALGNTAGDKQMQIRKESAEQADRSPDNARSKQIITYPAETDPKGPAPCSASPSTETSTENTGMTQMTGEKRSGRPDHLSAKRDSDIRSDSKSLCDLSKAGETDGKVALCSSTNASSNIDSSTHNEVSVLTKPTTECNDPGNSEIQRSSATSNAVVKESCKAVSAQCSPNGEAAKPDTDADSNTCPQLSPEEDSEDTIPEKRDIDAVTPDPPPVFAMSSFWSEMEKLTINDILRLRMVSHAQHPSILAPLGEDNLAEGSHARDSGYFTHVDDSRPYRSSGDMSDFEEQFQDQTVPKQGGEEEQEASANPTNVLWVSEPDSLTADAEAEDVVVLSTDTAIPHSRFAEQQYLRKMCKNISMQNLRALENQPLRQILRNASVQSLRSLDDDNSADPFYHIDPSAQFSDDESVDGHGFSLSEMIEYLLCDDDAKSTVSETENLISSHISGTSVPETYDDFFSEFETGSLFFPEGSTGSDSSKMLPIFSCSRSASRNLQFPEVYDYFFPDSPPQSDEEEEREHSPPIRVVSRYDNKVSTLVSTSETTGGSKSFFWTSPLSLRRVRRTGIIIPPRQTNSLSLVPANSAKKTGRSPIQPFNVMGYEDQGLFPDPLLCDLESRIFRKLAEQPMRSPETALVDPRIDAPLLPLRQSDMCLVCIAFASWVMKSVSPQGADTWKAVLLANISALSAIRYLRRYVRDEATGAKPLHQSQS